MSNVLLLGTPEKKQHNNRARENIYSGRQSLNVMMLLEKFGRLDSIAISCSLFLQHKICKRKKIIKGGSRIEAKLPSCSWKLILHHFGVKRALMLANLLLVHIIFNYFHGRRVEREICRRGNEINTLLQRVSPQISLRNVELHKKGASWRRENMSWSCIGFVRLKVVWTSHNKKILI